ncbi:MAG: hypothetical protein H8E31_02440 [Planctomycetes bacterium]|nr:hypothetical protein [Planctomycetota bacterium]
MPPCALLALFIGLVLPQATPDPAATHERPAAGFAIDAPGAGWSLQETGDPDGGGYTLVLSAPESGGLAALTVRVSPNGPPEDPAAYRDAVLASIEGQAQYHDVEEVVRSVAGREAPGFALDTDSAGVRYRVRQYTLAEQGYRYTVQGHAPAGTFAEHEAAFARALDSFRFLPLSGEPADRRKLQRLASRCGSEWDWAPDWKTAAARARAEGKLVLLYARFYPGFDMSDSVISGPLMDPDIVALGQEHFVPLRLTRQTEAPFRSAEVYGMGGSTFGQGVLVADADGDILAEDSLLQSLTLYAALLRGLEAGGVAFDDGRPEGEGAAAALARAKWHRRQLDSAAAFTEIHAALAAADAAGLAPDAPLRDELALTQATVLIGSGQVERAEQRLRAWLEERPGSPQVPEARFLLGGCRFHFEDLEGSKMEWLGLAEEYPDSRWAWQAAALLQSTFFEQALGADLAWEDPARIARFGWRPAQPLAVAAAARAEADALAWLLADQLSDGSWIGPSALSRIRRETDDVFTVAHTALAGSALLPHREDAAVAGAVDRALAFLFASRERERQHEPQVFYMDYTPWSRAASIDFLVDCLDAGVGDAAALRALAAELVSDLVGKQKPGGGWSYYLSGSIEGAARPAPQSISFTTAAVVIALLRAEGAGIEVPAAVRRAGLQCLEDMRNPNGTFEYMTSPGQPPREVGNGRPGAAGRGPVCATALVLGEREELDDLRERLDIAMEHLEELSREQGKGLMHAGAEAQGSHYLMFDYATCAKAVAMLPKRERAKYRRPLLEVTLQARNADGSYTDNPIIGAAAGTALALIAFERLRN